MAVALPVGEASVAPTPVHSAALITEE
jgi:hypothetical protein